MWVVKPEARPGTSDPDQPVVPPAGDHLVDTPVLPGHTAPGQKTVAQLSHPSRLVFQVAGDARIPYTTADLLDWSQFTLSVNPIAAIGPSPTADEIAKAPAIQRPAANETAIEMPYRLVISPNHDVAWDHRQLPFFHAGQCEMWHTRMFGKSAGAVFEPTAASALPLRAIWSDDFNAADPLSPPKSDPDLGRTAMSPNDRSQIVVLTSAFHGYEADYLLFSAAGIGILSRVAELALGPISTAIGLGLTTTSATANPALSAGPTDLTLSPTHPLTLSSANALSRAEILAIQPTRRRFPVTRPYVPEPFFAEQLFLSPLGGWLKSRGAWDPLPRKAPPGILKVTDLGALIAQLQSIGGRNIGPVASPAARELFLNDNILALLGQAKQPPVQLDLSEWVHVATEGRDHYVRIVYEGEAVAVPAQGRAVKVTERKFIEHDNIVQAHMVQRNFIVVRQPERLFSDADRAIPFKKVRLTTLVTPSIAEPQLIPGTHRSFWVEVMTGGSARQKFRFHGIGTDITADTVDFTVPLLFVSVSDLADPAKMALVRDTYNGLGVLDERSVKIPGQKVTFAPAKAAPGTGVDNTRLAARTLNFVVDAGGSPPQMLMAEVNIPQVQQLLQTDAATTIRYFKDYLAAGIDGAANTTGVFAEVVKLQTAGYTPQNPFGGLGLDTMGVSFSSDKAGGFATPDMGVSSLTSALGPLAGDVAKAAANQFNPAEFFPPGGLAKLFGSFDLADLLPPATHDKNAPKIRTDSKDIPGGTLLTVTLDWSPDIQNKDLGIAAFVKDHNGTTALEISGVIQKPFKFDDPLAAGDVTSEFTGKLNNFQVSVLKSVFINFVLFSFTAKSGHKPDVKVDLDPAKPVEFDGDLKFVEELRKAIPPGLFGDGPSLDIAPTGIRAGFELALPPVAVGVFALKDITLGAAITLPFLSGKPSFDFNVSQRCHPFQVAVAFFAGGGFFHLQLDTAGMKQLEAAIEFGAAASIDIGVGAAKSTSWQASTSRWSAKRAAPTCPVRSPATFASAGR